MSDKIRIFNNRLGNTTLAAPRDLPVAVRAALQTQLTQGPGGYWDLDVATWEAMAAIPGNMSLVLNGEISTRKEDVERRRPPASLERVDRTTLGTPRGPGDFVHGLRADPALMAAVERARKGTAGVSSRAGIAQAALAATRPGDYSSLVEQLASQGVNLSALYTHIGRASGHVTSGAATLRPPVPHADVPAPPSAGVKHDVAPATIASRDLEPAKGPPGTDSARQDPQDRRTGKK